MFVRRCLQSEPGVYICKISEASYDVFRDRLAFRLGATLKLVVSFSLCKSLLLSDMSHLCHSMSVP